MLSRRRFFKVTCLAPVVLAVLGGRGVVDAGPALAQDGKPGPGPGPLSGKGHPGRFPFSLPEREVYLTYFPTVGQKGQ